ncbi:MAG: Mov34/MPN/PAD-1 family protein [Acidobacteriota bacterium]
MIHHIEFGKELLDELIYTCRKALPQKAYGIIAGKEWEHADELYPLRTNLRSDDAEIDKIFASYGEFYCDRDRGFWIDRREQHQVFKAIEVKGQRVIGIYHSHRFRMAVPSPIDIELHYDPDVLLVIVSLATLGSPDVKAFRIFDKEYHEARITIVP